MGTMNIDTLLAIIRFQQEKRDDELRSALRSPDSRDLNDLLTRDAARIVASIGGYLAPQDPNRYDEWIKQMLFENAGFHAKAMVVRKMIQEYVMVALETSLSRSADALERSTE